MHWRYLLLALLVIALLDIATHLVVNKPCLANDPNKSIPFDKIDNWASGFAVSNIVKFTIK